MGAFDLSIALSFKETTCITCGIVIVLPSDYYNKRIKDHQNFYCPNGHSQHFIGETEEQRLKKKLEGLKRRLEWKDDELESERRSHRSTRGHLTRQKKRIANGVCPCCTRSFKNLARHMETMHPDYERGTE